MRNSSSLSKALGATAVSAGALIASNVAALMGEAAAQAAAAGLGAAALGAAALLLLRTGRAVRQATAVCRAISDGDFECRVVGIEAGGDIGRLMSAINDLIDRSDAYVRESAAAMQAVRANSFFRKIREEGLHGGLLRAARTINEAMASIESRLKALEAETTVFEGSIHGIVESVATASGAMGETAASLSGGAGETVTRAAGVGSAIEQATANIQSIAAACTELTSSAKEVGHQVDRSAELTRKTVARAAEAEHTIKTMSRAGQNIAEVAGLIRSIAAQTNLLALNATIEAARAGEAGKGFAVVAQEVKSLALQTARATGEIDTHIAEVQGATQAAVAAISEIGGMVLEVDHGTAGLAETMRAQVLATNEIAGNIEQAFAGFRDISGNIRAVTANAGETERLAAGTREASTRLAQQSQRLAEEARRFIVALRTGPLGRAEAAAAANQPPQAVARPGARPALKLVAA